MKDEQAQRQRGEDSGVRGKCANCRTGKEAEKQGKRRIQRHTARQVVAQIEKEKIGKIKRGCIGRNTKMDTRAEEKR